MSLINVPHVTVCRISMPVGAWVVVCDVVIDTIANKVTIIQSLSENFRFLFYYVCFHWHGVHKNRMMYRKKIRMQLTVRFVGFVVDTVFIMNFNKMVIDFVFCWYEFQYDGIYLND